MEGSQSCRTLRQLVLVCACSREAEREMDASMRLVFSFCLVNQEMMVVFVCDSSARGSSNFFWPPWVLHAYGAQRACKANTHTH